MGLRPGVSSSRQALEARIDEELSRLVTEFTNEINWHMREQDVTRAEVANRMGVSPGRVSQILSGGENLTLRTLASVTTALDTRCEMTLHPIEGAADGDGNQHAGQVDQPAEEEEDRPLWRVGRLRQSIASRSSKVTG